MSIFYSPPYSEKPRRKSKKTKNKKKRRKKRGEKKNTNVNKKYIYIYKPKNKAKHVYDVISREHAHLVLGGGSETEQCVDEGGNDCTDTRSKVWEWGIDFRVWGKG